MKSESENKSYDLREKTVPKYEANLAKDVVSTLNASLDNIDDLTLMRLQQARSSALSYPLRVKRHWISMSLAASIIIFVAAPMLWQENQDMNIDNADSDFIAQDIPFAAQEMDDMDMLIAMDDTDL